MRIWTMAIAAVALGLGACSEESDDDTGADSGLAGGGAGGEHAGHHGGEGGTDGVTGGGGAGGDEVGGELGDGGTGGAGEGPLPSGNFPRDGLWAATLDVVEISNYKLPLQLEIDGTEADGKLDAVTLRAVSADGTMISDPLVTVNDVAVDAEGHFQFGFEHVTLPAAYTVTGSDVVVSVTFTGDARGNDFMCGSVTGAVETLEIALEVSTFGAVPWETPADQRPYACESGMQQEIPHLDPVDCPALVEGVNADFPSAGLARTFRVFVPATWTAEKKYPLIFLWHGLGQSQDEIQENSALETYVDDKEFLLVVPDSQAEDKPGVEWDQLSVGENEDLVFFDDTITCMDKTYGVDLDRVHTTGLSAGGLWTTYLTMFRSEAIASSVAFSGGLLVPYPEPERKRPMIVAWGGPEDIAFDQNFDTLAHNLLGTLLPAGHFVVECNHGQKHKWLPEFTPWALQFLLDHPRNAASEPYAEGLPEGVFPEYCGVSVLPE